MPNCSQCECESALFKCGRAPCCIEITVADFGNAECELCEDEGTINGTFRLAKTDDPDTAIWTCTRRNQCTGSDDLTYTLTVELVDGSYIATIVIDDAVCEHTFTRDLGTQQPRCCRSDAAVCQPLVGSYPWQSDGAGCKCDSETAGSVQVLQVFGSADTPCECVSFCSFCTQSPQHWRVVVSGYTTTRLAAPNNCDDCGPAASPNGTYVLDRTSYPWWPEACPWTFVPDFVASCTAVGQVTIEMYEEAGKVRIRAFISNWGTGSWDEFYDDFDYPLDCMGIANLSLTWRSGASGSAWCTGAARTLEITAL